MAAVSDSIGMYGFKKCENFDAQTHEEFMASYLRVLAKRAKKWKALIGNKTSISKSLKVKKYIRKGIPSEFRPMVWMSVSGAQKRMIENPGLYHKLLCQPKDEEVIDAIKADLHRTFPNNIQFMQSHPSGKQRSLFNVLTAFALFNQRIGYCQGLNYIAGLMLLIVEDEEKVFWLLDTLVTYILPDLYAPDMEGLQIEQQVFAKLVSVHVPEVHSHVKKYDVPWVMITTKYFICLFIDSLPIETVLRIWDCMFYEGEKVLFRVGLTLMKKNADEIIATKSFESLTNVFKDIKDDPSNVYCHQFMQRIYEDTGKIPKALFKKYRQVCRENVILGKCD